MKLHFFATALTAACLSMTGCSSDGSSTSGMIQSGMMAMKAATLTDADVRALSDEACTQEDAQNKIAPANSTYTKRVNKIAAGLGHEVEGLKLNYKVYLTEDVNAWAMANGCIRVYSGLMDLMNDNEVAGVVGHEIGHVALGHTRKATQTAYAAAAARGAAASAGGVIGSLSNSQLGQVAEALVNAKFSRTQEAQSDDYSYDLLTQRGLDHEGLASAFEKLAAKGGGENSMFSSHPGSNERAAHIRQRIAADKK